MSLAERNRTIGDGTVALSLLPGRGVDLLAAAQAVHDLLVALGVETADPELCDTPRRAAAAYADLVTPTPFRATTFPNDEGYDELVVVRAIPFHALCRDDLLPFSGVAHIGYLPGDRILGLSKFARVLDHFARGLRSQEQLTRQVADWLEATVRPRGVGVVLVAEHACVGMRGAREAGARTITSALRGCVREDERTRHEFLAAASSGET